MIKVLTGDNCPACEKITKALKQNKIDFDLIHQKSKSGKKIVKKYGIKSIPFTIIRKGGIERRFMGSSVKKILECIENMPD